MTGFQKLLRVIALPLIFLLPACAADPVDRARLYAYDLFLRHLNQTQTAALPSARAASRVHFRDDYDFPDTTIDALIQASGAYVTAVAAIDAQASAIIGAAKAQYRTTAAVKGARVPPPPSGLQALQSQKEDAIRGVISSLETKLGPAQVAYVTSHLMAHVTVQKASAKAAQ